LVSDRDKLLSQFFESIVIGNQRFDLWGLFGWDTLGELFAVNVALEHKIGALSGFGAGAGLFEELAAQGAAAKTVDGLDLLEDLIPALFELG
jgi:hypothetical protein